jgi:hypothetical protein
MSAAMPFQQNRAEMRRRVALVPGWAMVWILQKTMQLHTGAEDFGNVIFRYSELPSQYHFDASIDVNRM